MMDHCDEESSGSIDQNSKCPETISQELKCCADCRTTKTPLWRGGPSGPKSLCNACGIRYRKKRRALLGLKEGSEEEKEKEKKKKKKKGKGSKSMMGVLRLLGLGRNVLVNQSSELHRRHRLRLREEEEAAVLLMALSSGLLYA